ncbi:MAG: DUF6691 family protein [Pseudomonadota bacterium]
MKKLTIALLCGLVFGLGLLVSGMSNPAKVLGFLDLAGSFDPSLMFVMAGAVALAAVAFWLARRRGTTLLGGQLHLAGAGTIDKRLVVGALTFGAGWGLAGFCPGPALAVLATGAREPLIFTAAMLAGMALFSLIEARR